MDTAPTFAQAARIAIIGGGAAGYFAAITCKRMAPRAEVVIYERNDRGLRKVLASGGGRCNLTHNCLDPDTLTAYYPRGARELRGPFHTMGPRETIAWFEREGLALKAEADGRIFPITDRSGSVAQLLEQRAREAGVRLKTHTTLSEWAVQPTGGFKLWFNKGETTAEVDAVLVACGGLRETMPLRRLLEALGHTVHTPLPSLFTFKSPDSRLRGLSGVSVPNARLSIDGEKLAQTGPLLITHRGFSGPAALRLSAWNAPLLHEKNYQFRLKIGWLADVEEGAIRKYFDQARRTMPKRHIAGTSPFEAIAQRLWERLVSAAGISEETRWNTLSREKEQALGREVCTGLYLVEGRAQNKDEFVTCGGVALNEVHFKTMRSRLVEGLYFAGEVLDIDAVTGGFNLQAAWTTGMLAGQSIAATTRHSGMNDPL